MGTRQEDIEEHELGEEAGWGLVSDDLTGLTGKTGEAMARTLDSEYGFFLEVSFTTYLSVKHSLIF